MAIPEAQSEFPDLGDKYVITRWLGGGGFGDVYAAELREFKVQRAIKVLKDRPGSELLSSIRREVEAVSRVQAPHVAQFHDYGRTQDGRLFVAFELCHGEPLSVRLGKGALDVDDAITILRQLVAGCRAIHEVGIVHRDLKPDNIMLVDDRGELRAKILDFGIARINEVSIPESLENPSTYLGACTPPYAPPEYHDPRTMAFAVAPTFDAFSLGAIAYEMLAGARAFPGKTYPEVRARVMACQPTSLATINPALAKRPRLCRSVHSMLTSEPEDRPSLERWIMDLEELVEAPRQRPLAIGIGIVAAIALGIFIVDATADPAGQGVNDPSLPEWAEVPPGTQSSDDGWPHRTITTCRSRSGTSPRGSSTTRTSSGATSDCRSQAPVSCPTSHRCPLGPSALNPRRRAAACSAVCSAETPKRLWSAGAPKEVGGEGRANLPFLAQARSPPIASSALVQSSTRVTPEHRKLAFDRRSYRTMELVAR